MKKLLIFGAGWYAGMTTFVSLIGLAMESPPENIIRAMLTWPYDLFEVFFLC